MSTNQEAKVVGIVFRYHDALGDLCGYEACIACTLKELANEESPYRKVASGVQWEPILATLGYAREHGQMEHDMKRDPDLRVSAKVYRLSCALCGEVMHEEEVH